MFDKHDDAKKPFNPRHRVIGAVLLIVVAAIALPFVLNRKHYQETPAAAPGVKTVVMDVAPTVSSPSPTSPQTPAAVPASTVVAATPAVPPSPPAAVAAKPASPVARTRGSHAIPIVAKPAVHARRWYVQLGTFSKPENARALQHKLAVRGFSVHLEPVKLAHGRGTRVRLGPYSDERAAKAMLERVRKKAGVAGVTVAEKT